MNTARCRWPSFVPRDCISGKRPSRRLALLLPLAAAIGCAEATLVRSAPGSARVYYRDRFVGVTPVKLVVPHSDLRDPIVLRVENDGYRPQDVPVPTRIGPPRIVGGLFSLGLSFIFKRPTTLPDRVDVALIPLPVAPAAAPPPPP